MRFACIASIWSCFLSFRYALRIIKRFPYFHRCFNVLCKMAGTVKPGKQEDFLSLNTRLQEGMLVIEILTKNEKFELIQECLLVTEMFVFCLYFCQMLAKCLFFSTRLCYFESVTIFDWKKIQVGRLRQWKRAKMIFSVTKRGFL